MKSFVGVSFIVFSAFLFGGCTAVLQNTQTIPTSMPTPSETLIPTMHHMIVSSEQDFILQMIPHHQEAIDTSKIVTAQTQDAELKTFTQTVIKVQADEVKQMQQWLKQWYKPETLRPVTYVPMMSDLTQLTEPELDKSYIQGMIVHHQGAIEMAEQVLKLNPRVEVKQMAEGIITVQQKEVEILQRWLDTKYGVSHSMPGSGVDHGMIGH